MSKLNYMRSSTLVKMDLTGLFRNDDEREEIKALIEKVHEGEDIPLLDYDCNFVFKKRIENVSQKDFNNIIGKLRSISYLMEHQPDRSELWTRFKLSLPDISELDEIFYEPSIGELTLLDSLSYPIDQCGSCFKKFKHDEFKKVLELFESDLSKHETSEWNLNKSFNISGANEATMRMKFIKVLGEILELLSLMNISIELYLGIPIDSEIVPRDQESLLPELKEMLYVRPDIICKGNVQGNEVQIPIEIKDNIGSLVDEIVSTGEVYTQTSLKIIGKCLSLCLQTMSKTCILSDYYKTVIMDIDFENTFGKDEDGEDFIKSFNFKYVIVRNDATGFTLRKALLWVFYRSFVIQDSDEISNDGLKLTLLIKNIKRLFSVREREEEILSPQLEEKSIGMSKMKDLTVEELELETIERQPYYTISTMPFHKYKDFFNQDAKDEGFDKVLIKVWNPKGTSVIDVLDQEEEVGDLRFKTELCRSLITCEARTLMKINSYNKRQERNSIRFNAPKLLTTGSCRIKLD